MWRRDKFTETESGLVVARGWGRGEQGVTANGYGISFWGDEYVLKFIVVMVVQHCGYTENH